MTSFSNGLKWLAILLVAVLLAPNLNAEDSADVDAVPSAAPTPEHTYVVAFAQDTLANDWRKAQVDELREALAPYPFIRFLSSDAQGQTAKQILDIEDFITQEVDVLVTSPRDAKALTPVISRAYRQGIAVVLLSRRIENDNYTIFIGADDRRIGRQAARRMSEVLGGHGRILMLKGLSTASTAKDRTEAFKQELANHPGLEIVAEKSADYLRSKAIQVVEEVLQARIPFDSIYAQSDSMASGARLVLKGAGREPRNFHILGVDYIKEAREAIRSGEQDASFTYPTGGQEGARHIIKIIRGEPIPKNLTLDSVMVTQDNVEVVEPIF
ncbi:substrate-binding domain-containing protein [Pseudomonadota bacterium]